MTAVPLRRDFDAATLRAVAKKTKDAAQARRLLALAAIYEGAMRTDAAKIGDVTLQIVRDWVVKFKAHGPDAVVSLFYGCVRGRLRKRDKDWTLLGRRHCKLLSLLALPRGREPLFSP